jgi:hypothetical protein
MAITHVAMKFLSLKYSCVTRLATAAIAVTLATCAAVQQSPARLQPQANAL